MHIYTKIITVDDLIKDFYNTNEIYLKIVYKNQEDFLNKIHCGIAKNVIERSEDNELDVYDIKQINIRISEDLFVKREYEQLNILKKIMNKTDNMKEYNLCDKQICKLKKQIKNKTKMIKLLFNNL